jgi:hypothetical protein
MSKYIVGFSTLSVLLSPIYSAHAQMCPDLAGVFKCEEDTANPYLVSIKQAPSGSTMAYEFNSQSEGIHRIVADGSSQNIESRMGKGTYSARCAGNHMETIFMLTTADGRAFQVKDVIRKERKALVRIRLSLPSSQIKVKDVYICRPYFPPRR